MLNAFRVLWKTVKSIWEDMLLLVLMNGLTFLAALPAGLIAYLIISFGLEVSTPENARAILALMVAALAAMAVPTFIPFAGCWAALYAACNRVANGFALSWEFFFAAFRQNIWKWWRYLLLSFTVLLLLLLNFLWYPLQFPDEVWVLWVQGAWLAALIFWVAIQFYAFPFYVEQEVKSWKVALRNGALVAGANPIYTLILLIVVFALLGLSLLIVPPLFVLVGWLLWVMTGSEAVADRVKAYRDRLEAEERKKNPGPAANRPRNEP